AAPGLHADIAAVCREPGSVPRCVDGGEHLHWDIADWIVVFGDGLFCLGSDEEPDHRGGVQLWVGADAVSAEPAFDGGDRGERVGGRIFWAYIDDGAHAGFCAGGAATIEPDLLHYADHLLPILDVESGGEPPVEMMD